ncbi:hypothetical protein HK099_002605 [Clydaea vesicula]|uniref:Cytidyltransferase-like domain-containing protein n=1 Tax=Clydaea vesicula TaxID=447962 RepID=A0AAD5XZ75_9FUNG|nr:hypothetical protein HK099_002605 [Clydaea vesicula]
MERTIFLPIYITTLDKIEKEYLNLLKQSTQYASESLIILLNLPKDFLSLPKIKTWKMLQCILSEIYVFCFSLSWNYDKPFLDINVIINNFCNYNVIKNLHSPETVYYILTKDVEKFNNHDNLDLKLVKFNETDWHSDYCDLKLDLNRDESATIKFRENEVDQYECVALGGTFDHLHVGHKILLTVALWITRKILRCGVSVLDEVSIKKKAGYEGMESLDFRKNSVLKFLKLMKVDSSFEMDVFDLLDAFGPTKDDPNIEAVIGSLETKRGCEAINEVRKSNNLALIDILIIDVISKDSVKILESEDMGNLKISSSKLRLYLLEKVKKTTQKRD